MYKKQLKPLSTHLTNILQQLQITKKDRIDFQKDAVAIQKCIMYGIKKREPRLRNAIRGLHLTASYLDNLKIHVPDAFDYHVKLELDFNLDVIKDPDNDGYVYLRSEFVTDDHPILSESGYVDRRLLQTWLRGIFKPVIEDLKEIHCISNNIYVLKYELQGYDAHSISAIDKRQPNRSISFDFVPAFQFPSRVLPHFENGPLHLLNMRNHWYAVPQCKPSVNNYTFMVCAPHWKHQVRRNKHKLKYALCLMKALRDTNDMSHLTSYMLKSEFLLALTEKPENFWKRTMPVIFAKMLGRLLSHLNRKRLENYLAPKRNHLSRAQINRFRWTVQRLLRRLNGLKKYANPVAYEDVVALFQYRA